MELEQSENQIILITKKTHRSKHKTSKEGRSNRETIANPKINSCTIHIAKLIDLNEIK
jgi:hypothetical protein